MGKGWASVTRTEALGSLQLLDRHGEPSYKVGLF